METNECARIRPEGPPCQTDKKSRLNKCSDFWEKKKWRPQIGEAWMQVVALCVIHDNENTVMLKHKGYMQTKFPAIRERLFKNKNKTTQSKYTNYILDLVTREGLGIKAIWMKMQNLLRISLRVFSWSFGYKYQPKYQFMYKRIISNKSLNLNISFQVFRGLVSSKSLNFKWFFFK